MLNSTIVNCSMTVNVAGWIKKWGRMKEQWIAQTQYSTVLLTPSSEELDHLSFIWSSEVLNTSEIFNHLWYSTIWGAQPYEILEHLRYSKIWSIRGSELFDHSMHLIELKWVICVFYEITLHIYNCSSSGGFNLGPIQTFQKMWKALKRFSDFPILLNTTSEID